MKTLFDEFADDPKKCKLLLKESIRLHLNEMRIVERRLEKAEEFLRFFRTEFNEILDREVKDPERSWASLVPTGKLRCIQKMLRKVKL